jgi:hypothetical protein
MIGKEIDSEYCPLLGSMPPSVAACVIQKQYESIDEKVHSMIVYYT